MVLLDSMKTILFFALIKAACGIYKWGRFDIQSGFSLNTSLSFQHNEVSSTCECRSICEYKYCCFAYSVTPIGSKLWCSLYLSFPKEALNVLSSTSDAEIGSKIVPGWKKGEDGLYYKLLDTTLNSWDEAKSACAALEMGARLAVVKTLATLSIIAEYAAVTPHYVAIDMKKEPDTSLILGDGTLFINTPLIGYPEKFLFNDPLSVDIFIVTRGQIHDENKIQPLNAVCQANFLGIKY